MGGFKDMLGDQPPPWAPYGGKPPARPGNPTQQAAAESVVHAAPTMRERVFQCIAGAGENGRTYHEIAADLGMRLQTVCGRGGELRSAGRIADTGVRRKTDTGRDAIVWGATK